MVHWPLNNPHRVENHDEVNISVTTEHFTPEVRSFYAIIYANGLLRAAGISGSRHSYGARKYAKMALAAAHKMLYKRIVGSGTNAKSQRSFRLDMLRRTLWQSCRAVCSAFIEVPAVSSGNSRRVPSGHSQRSGAVWWLRRLIHLPLRRSLRLQRQRRLRLQ